MPTLRLLPLAAGLTTAVLVGCSPVLTRGPEGGGAGKTITAEQIRRSGVRTAWEAVTRLLPNISFSETRDGQPRRLARRGASSLYLADVPRLVVDGVLISDYRTLESISAQSIASIQLLSGLDGTTNYGTNAGDGVIVIRTRVGGE